MKNALMLPALLAALSLSACASSGTKASTTPNKTNKIVDIRKAAMPFKLLIADGGKEIATDKMFAKLANAQAVCIGESHPNPHHHWAQLQLFDRLSKQNKAAGVDTALGMEMFPLRSARTRSYSSVSIGT